MLHKMEPEPKPAQECQHDLAERETSCADGMCPICLREQRAVLVDALDTGIKRIKSGNVQAGIMSMEHALAKVREGK